MVAGPMVRTAETASEQRVARMVTSITGAVGLLAALGAVFVGVQLGQG
jgi:hypothetical protein